jgi:hypothetical protein
VLQHREQFEKLDTILQPAASQIVARLTLNVSCGQVMGSFVVWGVFLALLL